MKLFYIGWITFVVPVFIVACQPTATSAEPTQPPSLPTVPQTTSTEEAGQATQPASLPTELPLSTIETLEGTGGIEGIVYFTGTNPKTPVPNVTVQLSNFDTSESAGEVKTDEQGFYSFINLEPGQYTWTVISESCIVFNFVLSDENKITVAASEVVKKDIDINCK